MIGTRLGRYEITAPLGKGGMGEVYRATDSKLKRQVAIKVLPSAFTADEERLKRFEREAQLLAQLQHPNIASIFGFEESGGIRALAMELVEGPTLGERLAAGPLSIEESVAVALQVAQALEAAHERGIVHRDLKPQNIKAPIDGRVKVLDFGLAKAMDSGRPGGSGAASASQLEQSPTVSLGGTEMGVILGTAAYMAPEQAKGLPVDRRADIWAFGVVLYEMLAGRRLFQGDTVPETLASVIRADIDLSLLPVGTPPGLRRLLERCLDRNPRNRLRDIGEARVALEAPGLLEERTVPSSHSAKRSAVASWGRFAAVAALGVALGLGVAALRSGRAPRSSSQPELKIAPLTTSGNVIGAAVSPDGRYVAYVESEQGLQSLWLQQLAGGQTLRLIPERGVQYWGHTFSRDGNHIVFGQKTEDEPAGALYSISTLGGAATRLLEDIDSAVTFSPDGREMAFARARHPTTAGSALIVARADGSNQRVLASFAPPDFVAGIFFGGPAWSPDGQRIALAVGRNATAGAETRARLAAVSLTDGEVTTLAEPGWVGAAQAAWLPDGKSLLLIAAGRDQQSPQIWSVTYPGGMARPVTNDLNEHRMVSLTADGSTLVSVAAAYTSSVWSVRRDGSASPRRVSRSIGDGMFGVCFAPEGTILYGSVGAQAWSLWSVGLDAADRTPMFTLRDQHLSESGLGPLGRVGFPAVAPDGTVYFAVRATSGAEIRAVARDGSALRTVVRDVLFHPFALSADGRFLVFTAPDAGFWRLQRVAVDGSGREPVFAEPAAFPALDPAATKVAYYHEDAGKLRLRVRALAGGPLLLDVPAEPPGFGSRLVLRDEGVYLNTVRGDRANVWLLPTGGGEPRRLTAFDEQWLIDFAVSGDGRTLAVSRGPRLRDAQLITGFAATQR